MIFQLLSRGYNFKVLCSLQSSIEKIPQKNLLEYKTTNKIVKYDNNQFFIPNEYNKFIINKIQVFKCSISETMNKFSWLTDYKLKFYNLISVNIFSILIHNRNLNNNIHYTKKCNISSCKLCEFVNPNSYILLKSGFIIPISDTFNCSTSNVIYIIRCTLCNVFYIGQTMRSASERLKEQVNDIIKFIPYIKNTSEVGLHFNLNKRHLCFVKHIWTSTFFGLLII